MEDGRPRADLTVEAYAVGQARGFVRLKVKAEDCRVVGGLDTVKQEAGAAKGLERDRADRAEAQLMGPADGALRCQVRVVVKLEATINVRTCLDAAQRIVLGQIRHRKAGRSRLHTFSVCRCDDVLERSSQIGRQAVLIIDSKVVAAFDTSTKLMSLDLTRQDIGA